MDCNPQGRPRRRRQRQDVRFVATYLAVTMTSMMMMVVTTTPRLIRQRGGAFIVTAFNSVGTRRPCSLLQGGGWPSLSSATTIRTGTDVNGNSSGRKPTTTTSSARYLSSSSSSSSSPQQRDLRDETRHLPRLYIENGVFSERGTVPLTNGQVHYLVDVMRITSEKRWGSDYANHVRIFGGGGDGRPQGEWLARVLLLEEPNGSSRKQQQRRQRQRKGDSGPTEDVSTTAILECIEPIVSPPVDRGHGISVHLYVSRLKKREQRRFVLEKATELGVDSISFLRSDYSDDADADDGEDEEDVDHTKHRSYVVEASEQCERYDVPTISPKAIPLPTLLRRWTSDPPSTDDVADSYWLVCRERSEFSPPILSVLETIRGEGKGPDDGDSVRKINLVVGPEGGWSPREAELFDAVVGRHKSTSADVTAAAGTVLCVSLGPLVLRAETAAVAAVAAARLVIDANVD